MFGMRWQVCRILGIPVSVDLSWLLILALLTLSFAEGFPKMLQQKFPHDTVALPAGNYWIMGLITALAFFTCVLLHEFGHALVGRSRGMPIKGITLFMFGGVSELGDEPQSAGTEFLMAIAGPVVSLFLGAAFWVLAVIGHQHAWPHPAVIVLGYLAFINIVVLIFNMVPAFPLDGGRVLRSILWGATGNLRRSTHWASIAGQAFAWVLIALGVMQFFQGQWVSGLWSVFIGFFLNNAAQSGYQQVLIKRSLRGESVRRFMNANPIVVSPTLNLLHWVEDYVYRYHHRAFPVTSDGRLEGIITTEALNQIPRGEWAEHTVGEFIISDLRSVSISTEADALDALMKMQQSGSNLLLVTDVDRLVGIISLKDLLTFLNLKLELEGRDDGRPLNRNSSNVPSREEPLVHH